MGCELYKISHRYGYLNDIIINITIEIFPLLLMRKHTTRGTVRCQCNEYLQVSVTIKLPLKLGFNIFIIIRGCQIQ